MTLKFDGWPRKIIRHLFYATSSFVHHFIAISEFKLELQSRNAQFTSNCFVPCDLEIWQMTLKNNRAPLLCHFKIWASFCSHLWIQTGITVRKCPNYGKICFDLCDFDLWPLTLTICMDITPENFMMDWSQEHCEKKCDKQLDRQTDGWTEVFLELLGRS